MTMLELVAESDKGDYRLIDGTPKWISDKEFERLQDDELDNKIDEIKTELEIEEREHPEWVLSRRTQCQIDRLIYECPICHNVIGTYQGIDYHKSMCHFNEEIISVDSDVCIEQLDINRPIIYTAENLTMDEFWVSIIEHTVGVYIFYIRDEKGDETNNIYIGSSINIKRRMIDHVKKYSIYKINFYVTETIGEARSLEILLIKNLRPDLNKILYVTNIHKIEDGLFLRNW